jgi:hypothetical protein
MLVVANDIGPLPLKTNSSSTNNHAFYCMFKQKTSFIDSRTFHLDACIYIEHAYPLGT